MATDAAAGHSGTRRSNQEAEMPHVVDSIKILLG
jgi:hypothetical protein